MKFEIKEDTPVRAVNDGSGVVIVSGPGGCPWVTDPARPHLGGNFDGGDLGTMYQGDLWPWLIETFGVKKFVDVGCGTGETLKWFLDQGCEGLGVEGLPWNAARCAERGAAPVRIHDFQDGPCDFEKFFPDLIWCSDVVEHIAEEYVDNILQTLRQCHVLAMCQGTEGDVGWNHVNNKPHQYWVDKLASVGMFEDVEATKKSRKIGNHGWWYASGRIYRRTQETK